MHRHLTALLLAATAFTPAYAAEITANSRISAVTVYPSGAEITRAAEARIEAGDHTLIFQGLPGDLQAETIRVEGSAEAKVEIDVVITVDVLHRRGLSPAHDDRMRVVRLEARRYAERHDLASPLGGLHRAGRALHVHTQLASGDVLRPTDELAGVDGFHCTHSFLQTDFVPASLPHHEIHRERPSLSGRAGRPGQPQCGAYGSRAVQIRASRAGYIRINEVGNSAEMWHTGRPTWWP